MDDYIIKNGELYHYGVLGMKWGVRRSQAKLNRVSKKAKRRGWSEDKQTVAEIKTKKVSQMSNNELKKLNERNQLEVNYRNLKEQQNAGQRAVSRFIKTAGTITAVTAAAAVYAKYGRKVVHAMVGALPS